MSNIPDVSIVVPVFNAQDTLRDLAMNALGTPRTSVQIILVDDNSSDNSAFIINDLVSKYPQIDAHFHGENMGAGVARNRGLELVQAPYTLFFDADDVLHPEALSNAVELLNSTRADVAMLPYHYQRGSDPNHTRMNLNDGKIWDSLMKEGGLRQGRLVDMSDLLGFSNYPWNKVIRTSVFREVGLKFGATVVHNDILGHWYSLLFADQIILLDHSICTHIVPADGANLTNQNSRTRMSLISALDETYALLKSDAEKRQTYSRVYWDFALRTFRWARARIDPSLGAEFEGLFREHLSQIDVSDFAMLRRETDPILATKIAKLMLAK